MKENELCQCQIEKIDELVSLVEANGYATDKQMPKIVDVVNNGCTCSKPTLSTFGSTPGHLIGTDGYHLMQMTAEGKPIAQCQVCRKPCTCQEKKEMAGVITNVKGWNKPMTYDEMKRYFERGEEPKQECDHIVGMHMEKLKQLPDWEVERYVRLSGLDYLESYQQEHGENWTLKFKYCPECGEKLNLTTNEKE